jgi:hypothetical protein
MDRNGNRILLNDTSNPQALLAYRSRANIALVPVSASPTLSVSLSAGNVLITWPASAAGFVLQETSALPDGWTSSTAAVTVQGSLNAVSIPPTAKVKFYRLQQ